MKKLFSIAVIAAGFWLASVRAHADEPVSVSSRHNSNFVIAQSSMAVSSNTVTTVPAVAGKFREVYIDTTRSDAVIFYRMDGSTQNIPTAGMGIPTGQSAYKIETDQAINFQLQVGTATQVVRRTIYTK